MALQTVLALRAAVCLLSVCSCRPGRPCSRRMQAPTQTDVARPSGGELAIPAYESNAAPQKHAETALGNETARRCA